MKSVLVIGSTGMLGSVVFRSLKKNTDLRVLGTVRKPTADMNDRILFDAEQLTKESHAQLNYDYIINCVGVIKPYCKDNDVQGVQRAIRINSLFPWSLAQEAKKRNSKVIQIATDCVYSGTKGKYIETDPHDPTDVYGKTKSLGEVFDGSLLNIRCSIIGPEEFNKVSLLEWFLAQPEGAELNGFSHHLWNGVTTLQFAEVCEKIIVGNHYDNLIKTSPIHHFVPNETVNKYELLNIMARVFHRNLKIKNVDNVGPKVDRTINTKFDLLRGIYSESSIESALMSIRKFWN